LYAHTAGRRNPAKTSWLIRIVDEEHPFFPTKMRLLVKDLAISFKCWYSSLILEEDGRIPMYYGSTSTPPRPNLLTFTTP
jgi:hypothetical protein